MASDEPACLLEGTEVSAKYKGAYCEAKIKKVSRLVKCRVQLKESGSFINTTDENIKNFSPKFKLGFEVEVVHPDSLDYVKALITKVQDCSTYNVVFDDGDENTLRRTQLCLKGDKHFSLGETLDQLPLTHPEHFGTPVMMKTCKTRTRGSRDPGDEDSDDSEEEMNDMDLEGGRRFYRARLVDLIGRVFLLELEERKRTAWVPVLVCNPNADEMELKTRDHVLVRSFKDGKFYACARRALRDFTRDVATKNEDKSLRGAFDKALCFHDTNELPTGWARAELLSPDSEEDDVAESDTEEQSEEKDHFVAQLYKFMDDRGTPMLKTPIVNGRDLDLFKLFRIVETHGGYNRVTNQMKWKVVLSRMSLASTVSTQLKSAYKRYLLAFEEFYRKLGDSMFSSSISRTARNRTNSGRSVLSGREKEQTRSPNPKAAETAVKSEPEGPAVEEAAKPEDKNQKPPIPEDSKAKRSMFGAGRKALKDPQEKLKLKTDDAEVSSPRKNRLKAAADEKKDKKEIGRPATRDEVNKVKVEQKADEKKSKAEDKKDDVRKVTRGAKDEEKKGLEAPVKAKVKEEKPDAVCTPAKDQLPKKRGRKKKSEDEESDKSDVKMEEPSASRPPGRPPRNETKMEFEIGSKLKVKYGKGKNAKGYEAKILQAELREGSYQYYVHYSGWNIRYDEWVNRDRVVEFICAPTASELKAIKLANATRQSATRTLKSSPGAKVRRGTKRAPGSTSPAHSTADSDTAPPAAKLGRPTTPQMAPMTSPVASGSQPRPTRSNSVEGSLVGGLGHKKRMRIMSGAGPESGGSEVSQGTDSGSATEGAEDEEEDDVSSGRSDELPVQQQADNSTAQLLGETDAAEMADECLDLAATATRDHDNAVAMEMDLEEIMKPLNKDADGREVSRVKQLRELAREDSERSSASGTDEEADKGKPRVKRKEGRPGRPPKVKKEEAKVEQPVTKADPDWEALVDKIVSPHKTTAADDKPIAVTSHAAETKDAEPVVTKDAEEEKRKPAEDAADKKVVRRRGKKRRNEDEAKEDDVSPGKKTRAGVKKSDADDSESNSSKCSTKQPPVTSSEPEVAPEVQPAASIQEADPVEAVQQPVTQQPRHAVDMTPPDTPERSPPQPPVADDACPSAALTMATEAKPLPTAPLTVLPYDSPIQQESSANSNGSGGSSGNVASSEAEPDLGAATSVSEVVISQAEIDEKLDEVKQQQDEVEEAERVKKKRKSRRQNSKSGSGGGRRSDGKNMSDSDEAAADERRSPVKRSKHEKEKPAKFKLNLDEGKYLEGEARISFLTDKIQEIRKVYMSLKAEVACIDRRRKKHKRKEKEQMALQLAALSQAYVEKPEKTISSTTVQS